MLKICGSTIYGPLEIIFKEALSTGLFPLEWKKGNVVPIHKKGDKQILKNYRLFHYFQFVGKFDRKQRIVLNGQKSTRENAAAGVPRSSILGSLLFLTYINDLSGDLSSKEKLSADDTSLSNVVHDIDTSANELNNVLKKVSNWTF